MRSRSAGSRNPGFSLSNRSLRSCVYRPVGKNEGGCVGRVGKVLSGSPIILRIIWNLSGSSPMTGFILRATGLYFFLPSKFMNIELLLFVGNGSCVSEQMGIHLSVKQTGAGKVRGNLVEIGKISVLLW